LDVQDDEGAFDEVGKEERRFLLEEQNKNLFKQEAVYFLKARRKWLQQGCLNTKYFHLIVAWRR